MKTINIQEIKDATVKQLTELRTLVKIRGVDRTVLVEHQALIRAFEWLVVVLHKIEKEENMTMEKIIEFIGEPVKIEEFQRIGEVDAAIIELASKVPSGERYEVKLSSMGPATFVNRVSKLRSMGRIPKNVSASVARNKTWLINWGANRETNKTKK